MIEEYLCLSSLHNSTFQMNFLKKNFFFLWSDKLLMKYKKIQGNLISEMQCHKNCLSCILRTILDQMLQKIPWKGTKKATEEKVRRKWETDGFRTGFWSNYTLFLTGTAKRGWEEQENNPAIKVNVREMTPVLYCTNVSVGNQKALQEICGKEK